MRIQHNIMAMNAYRNYNNNSAALSKNLEKLSSGYKINRAGDDAAGLAISEKMRAQITGLNAASKNVKDGISLVKTAEGAMQEVQDMLNRMDYLATQSANGTYQDEVDRENLQKEVDALKTEINRIADSANFNGIKLMDGSLDTSLKTTGNKDVAVEVMADGQLGKEPQAGVYSIDLSGTVISQAGDDDAEIKLEAFGQVTDTVSIKNGMSDEQVAEALAKQWNTDHKDSFEADYGTGFKITAEAQGSKLVFTMSQAPSKAWTAADTQATLTFTYANAHNNNAQQVTLTQEKEAIDSTTTRMYAQAKFDLASIVKDGATLTIGDDTYVFAVGSNSKYKDLDNVVDLTDMTAASDDLARVAANRLSTLAQSNTRFKVGSANNEDGTINITEKEGGVDYSKNNLAGADGKGTTRVDANAGVDPTPGDADATAADWSGLVMTGNVNSGAMGSALTLQIGDTSDSFNQMKVAIGDMHTTGMGIDGVDISSQTGAQAAVQTIKDAINYVSGIRGDLGATQNRLEHTANNLSVMAENIQDAESTIRDTDVAEEMMSYVKNNILVQSAQAMLAQANQVPQGVLQLLG
ncbi:MAG: flagellin [Oscillospiraceae bacterium]|nr:flagellin [Oscillospiraceae bacterium]